MGSAKTAMLLTQAYNFEERGMNYLCMKPIIDNREKENVIRSRIGIERKCSWIYPEMDLYRFLKEQFEHSLVVKDWILIDEVQFLTAHQIDSGPTSSRTCSRVRAACWNLPTQSTRSSRPARVAAKPSSMPASMRKATL